MRLRVRYLSGKDEILITIDDAALQALLAQMKASGSVTGGVANNIVAPASPATPSKPASGQTTLGPNSTFLPRGAGNGGIAVGSGDNYLWALPRGARMTMGIVGRESGLGNAGYDAARAYYGVRWLSGSLTKYSADMTKLVRESGGGLKGLGKAMSSSTGFSLAWQVAMPAIIAVNVLLSLKAEFDRLKEEYKRDVMKMTGVTDATYKEWEKIQSDPNPYLRRRT